VPVRRDRVLLAQAEVVGARREGCGKGQRRVEKGAEMARDGKVRTLRVSHRLKVDEIVLMDDVV